MASTKVQSPMVYGTEKIPGSRHFFGNAYAPAVKSSFLVNTETIPPTSTLPFILFLLCTHNSLRNFVCFGICFIASISRMLISTFRNILSSSSSESGLFAETARVGNGNGTVFFCCNTCESALGLESASADLGNCCDVGCDNAFPLLNVIALAFPFGFGMVCEGPPEMVNCLELAFSIVVVAGMLVSDIVESVVDNLLVVEIDVINEFCIETARVDSKIQPHMLPFSILESPRNSYYPKYHASNNSKFRVSVTITLMSVKYNSRIAIKLKPLLEHLKHAYLGDNQQFPIIIANNLHRDQEEKLLEVLKKHKKAIGWMLADLPGINPSICMHKILLEEDAQPIHIELVDQYKTTFTCPFGTFAYARMSFGLCDALSTFQRCMINIFWDLLKDCMEIFMDDFMVYAESFEACLNNLSKVLRRCIDSNLVLNIEKCHFMVTKGIVLGHLISAKGIEVDKAKIDVISSLPNLASVQEVPYSSSQSRSALGMLMAIAIGLSATILRNYAIATSSVGRD
ncbi:Retrovirus-related Pol polyprotein, partial [Mucuna pruriens]